MPMAEILALRKDCFGATPKPARGTRVRSGTNQTGRFCIQVSSNSESRTCLAEAASPSSHSSFCEEVFPRFVAAPLCRSVSGHGDRAPPWLQHTNEADRSNVLAPGFRSGEFPDAPFSRLHRLLWRQPY